MKSRPLGYLYWRSRITLPSTSNARMATAPGWRMYSRVAWAPPGMRTVSRRTFSSRPEKISSPLTKCSLRSCPALSCPALSSLPNPAPGSERLDGEHAQAEQRLRQDAQREERETVDREQEPHLARTLGDGLGRHRVVGLVEIH